MDSGLIASWFLIAILGIMDYVGSALRLKENRWKRSVFYMGLD